VILLGALGLRLTGLWELGLGFDELQHIYAARGLNQAGAPVLPSGMYYGRSLAFTYLVAKSVALFGDTAGAARLPSVLFSTATVGLVFLLGRRTVGTAAGLLAAALLAVAPFELTWARTARMYAVYQFFYILAAYAFYRGFEAEPGAGGPLSRALRPWLGRPAWLARALGSLDLEWLIVALLSFGVAFHLHPLAGSLGLSLVLYALVVAVALALAGHDRGPRLGKHALLAIALLTAASVLVAVPQVRLSVVGALTFAPDWTQNMPIQATYYLFWMNSQFMFPLFVFFLLGCLQAVTRLERGPAFVVICALVPLVLHSTIVRVQHPRYVYDFFPFVLLVACHAGCNLYAGERERLRAALLSVGRPRLQGLASLALAAALMVGFLGIPPALRIGTRIALHQGSGFGGPVNVRWDQACRFLAGSIGSDQRIVASIPLAADYSGCPRIDFNLDNGEIDQFFAARGDGLPMHSFANTPAIVDMKTLRQVLEPGGTLWFVLDQERFENNGNTPPDVRAFLKQNLQTRWTAEDGSVSVFSWTVPSDVAVPVDGPASAAGAAS
jgi:4-amino-4-deoxy-L-arabinose transferase-like glycosyltransferase